jgi:transglycosylase-like protein with SLT domain/D-alanyl-D-alanine carboxypeptidase-like protein
VIVLCTEAAGARDGLAQAAAVAVAAAGRDGASLLVALEAEPRRRSGTLLAAPGARKLEEAARAAGFSTASARGHLCVVSLPAEEESVGALKELEAIAGGRPVFASVPGSLWSDALAVPGAVAGLLSARLPRDRSLATLVAFDLRERGMAAKVAVKPLGRLAGMRALGGLDPGGTATRRAARIAQALAGERGQALPTLLGAGAAVIAASLFLVAIGGAVTGKGRAQRGADLAAISAARSMRDDIPRLSAPARLPDGSANPRHLTRPAYFARAASAAKRAAEANGIAAARVEVDFPDAAKPLPIRSKVTVTGEVEDAPVRVPVEARAVAEASPGSGGDWTGQPAMASGGGYSGPLAYRTGKPMRPDVAEAFDRMAAAARKAGLTLTVTSGFRSDAEQARLFAAHPDPTWVAPPGHSLHRCATELDLGPSSAYGWLAAHAPAFGFLKRYGWEPWHFGYTAGPPPCSEAGNSVGAGGDSGDGRESGEGVPSFVPPEFREPLRRSSARWGVPAAVLAAQLMAESGFDPHAVSPAGAQGIAQFMPGTAASYGLRNPFDPVAAIDAQAHLMSELMHQFGSVPLALAAYNAGPGAVQACHCSTPYAETAAYVARIMALLGGSGAMAAPAPEVRLVK